MSENTESIYRGFRLQDAYCLYRIITAPSTPAIVFQPEGLEDLRVTSSGGEVLEAVQAKYRSRDLTLSMLEPRNPNKFFARMASARRISPDLEIRLVSFGPIGKSLQDAFNGIEPHHTQAAITIAESEAVSLEEASDLLKHIKPEVLNDEDLTNRLLDQIKELRVGIDPENALLLLQSWIRRCAEKKIQITRSDLASKLDAIGRFLSERQAHHLVWDRSVKPFDEAKELTSETTAELRQRFYEGAAASYKHILADADVRREIPMQQIQAGLDHTSIVVIRGASGQGKSTLAYRYLHEHCLDHLRYEIQATSKPDEAQDIALAVSGHARAIGLPIVLYIDVQPHNYAWRDLVLQLSEIEDARILVTIREEDWKRGALAQYEAAHQTIELTLSEPEAREIYTVLDSRKPLGISTGFEDAWIKFGRGRALLEFAYFINQEESLQERLSKQINRLEVEMGEGKLHPAELEFLRLVAVATAYGARVSVSAITKHLNLPSPRITLKRFKGEHLIRLDDEEEYISGLHPIRSEILVELLIDTILYPWPLYAAACLALMEESDIANFLLYAFSRRGNQVEALLDAVKKLPVETWKGALGIVRSLLWLGLAQYVQQNGELLDEVYEMAKSGFWFILDFDFTDEALGKGLGSGLIDEYIHPTWRAKFDAFRARQTDKSQAFLPLREWFNTYNITLPLPSTAEDWQAYAEITFWCGRTNASSILVQSVSLKDLEHSFPSLSLETVALVIAGISVSRPETANAILSTMRLTLQERFQRETDTIRLEDDGENVRCEFIVPFGERQTLTRAEAKTFGDMNAQAMWRINILRLLFPDRTKYCAQGYGHKFIVEFDETERCIDRQTLPLDWITSFNAQFIELATRRYRPDDWIEFAESVMVLREMIVERITELRLKLRKYGSTRSIDQLWGEGSDKKYINGTLWDLCKSILEHPPALPKSAGDEWGFVRLGSPGTDKKIRKASTPSGAQAGTALTAESWAYQSAALYIEFATAYREYVKHWELFFQRGREVLALVPLVARRARSEAERQSFIERGKDAGAHMDARYATLSALNQAVRHHQTFQREFRSLLEKRVDAKRLVALEQAESTAYKNLWELWYLFALHAEKVYLDPVKSASSLVESVLDDTYEELVAQLKAGLGNSAAITVHRDGPQWKEQSALWIIVDGDDIDSEVTYVELLILSFIKTLPTDEARFLRYYAYDEFCEHLIVLPLLHGRSQNSQCWVFSMSNHAIDPNDSKIPSYEAQPKALPQGVIDHFGIKQWDSPILQACRDLVRITNTLWLYAKHISEITSIGDIDALGNEVASDYTIAISPDIQEVFDLISPCIEQLSEWLRSDTFENLLEQHPYAVKAMSNFERLSELLFPEIDNNQGTRTMAASQVADWESRLLRAREIANTMKELCMRDAVDRENS